jgi:hypothetical protein
MGTIKTTNIEPIADNGTVTLGSSGDTFTLGSGVTQTIAVNTPAFSIAKDSNQSTSADSTNLITWQVTNFDTHSGVDLTNNKYVVPTGQSGKYFLSLQVSFNYSTRFILSIWKNGSAIRELDTTGTGSLTGFNFNAILDLSAGDEINSYYYSVTSTGNIRQENSSGSQITRLDGFKLIG